jgi:hypothetical protein
VVPHPHRQGHALDPSSLVPAPRPRRTVVTPVPTSPAGGVLVA